MDDFTITSKNYTNDEGSDFCHVTIVWPDVAGVAGAVEKHYFSRYFDDGPQPSAVEQAASFVNAFIESQEYTLEERLGPFGLEWEREQEDRWLTR